MQHTNEPKLCQHCGAPVTSEICLYCGTPTGLNTARANMDYPTIDCKEVNLDFWNVCFPAIFAVGFGFSALTVMVMAFRSGELLTMSLFCIPFLLIGIGATYKVVQVLQRYIKVKTRGKKIAATVYGYMNDNLLINDMPAQIVKLLVQTPEGPRFILYQLGDTKQIYGVNTKIHLMVYKNYFLIDKSGESINWG